MKFRKWTDWKEGDYVVGKFIGTHVDNYEKENYKVQVLDAQFEDAELATELVGKNLVLNACGSLDYNWSEADVQVGDVVMVTYTGKALMEKGKYAGKEAHTMTLSIMGDAEVVDEGEQDSMAGF